MHIKTGILMNSKKYLYDPGQKSCLELLEKGFIFAFEEVLDLMHMNKIAIEQAQHGVDKQMPEEFRTDTVTLERILDTLIKSEKAVRKGALEDNYNTRMELGTHFAERTGYHWLAIYFYKSCYRIANTVLPAGAKLMITALKQLGLLEEKKENLDAALGYMERAVRVAKKYFLANDDPIRQELYEHLSRIYRRLGSEHLDIEEDAMGEKKSKSLRYYKKAASLATQDETLENQAACHALLGRAMMKFNDNKTAMQCFESYLKLCDECNDVYGLCNGYFAISEIHKRDGELEQSKEVLLKCQEVAKENKFDIPFIFSSVSLGQIATAQREYTTAHDQFETAYRILLKSKDDFANQRALVKLCRIMCGIGRANLSFKQLIIALQNPTDETMKQIISWRSTGGHFKAKIMVTEDHLIDLEEPEKGDKVSQTSAIIEKLIQKELTCNEE